jgi:hypothetical protein
MPEEARPPGAITRFNEWLAVHSTLVFGSMWMAYGFVAFCFLPVAVPSGMAVALYVSNCAQLVALPLLAVGQNVLGRAAERRADETHDAVMEELGLLRDAHEGLAQLVTGRGADAVAGGEA